MKTFLFPYPDRSTRRALAAERPSLDERGVRVVFAGDDPRGGDELVLPRGADVDEAVRAVEAYARRTPIDALILQTEDALMPGAILGNRLGLQALRPETVMKCVHRLRFREALKGEALQPRYALAESAADVRRFGQFPCILKGMASTNARHVVKVSSADDVDAAVEKFSARLADSPDVVRLRKFAAAAKLDLGCDPARQFLVEEFVDGAPRQVDGLAYDVITDPFGVVEQVPSAAPDFFIEGYHYSPNEMSGVSPRVLETVMALDLDPCGFSIEYRGHSVIKVNPRLGDDDGFPDYFKTLRSEYPIVDWIDYLNENTPGPCEADTAVAIAYASCRTGGVVREVPRAEGVEVLVKPGDRLHAAPRLAYAIRTHESSGREAFKEARAAVESLLFLIE